MLDRYNADADIDAGIDADDAAASAAAALGNDMPTDRASIPMMYADGGPLVYGDKQSSEDGGSFRGFVGGAADRGDLMYGSDRPGDLQMIESQMYEQALQPCFMPDARSARPTDAGCDVNEVCVSVRNTERGVCECAVHYARNQLGECVLRVRSAMDDLVEAAKLEAESRIMPLSVAAADTAPAAGDNVGTPDVATASTTPSQSPLPQTPKPLTVSVLSKDVRLPEREVTLAAYTISDDISGNTSQYRLVVRCKG